jgi:hypothetical protein
MKPKSFGKSAKLNVKKVSFSEREDVIPRPPRNSPSMTSVSQPTSRTSTATSNSIDSATYRHETGLGLVDLRSRNHHLSLGTRTNQTSGYGVKKNRNCESNMTTAEKLYIKSLMLPRIVVSSADDNMHLLSPLCRLAQQTKLKSTSAPDVFYSYSQPIPLSYPSQSQTQSPPANLTTAYLTTRSAIAADASLHSHDTSSANFPSRSTAADPEMKFVQACLQNVTI